MAERNMEKIIIKTEELFKHSKDLYHYSMSVKEICSLLQIINDGRNADAIVKAFYLGFSAGTRAYKKGYLQNAI